MSEFELESGPSTEPVSGPRLAGVLARRLRWERTPSAQTIANWRQKGMPTAGETGRGPLYDVETCERWVRANCGGGTRGGRRPGSGRPRKRPRPDGEFAGRVDATEAKAAARSRFAELVNVEHLLHCSHEELRAIIALDEEISGLTKVKLERLKLVQEARAKHRDELEKLGRLVDAEEARRAFTLEMTAIRERLEQLPHRLLRAVMSAGDVDGVREAAVLEALGREVAGVVGEIRAA